MIFQNSLQYLWSGSYLKIINARTILLEFVHRLVCLKLSIFDDIEITNRTQSDCCSCRPVLNRDSRTSTSKDGLPSDPKCRLSSEMEFANLKTPASFISHRKLNCKYIDPSRLLLKDIFRLFPEFFFLKFRSTVMGTCIHSRKCTSSIHFCSPW